MGQGWRCKLQLSLPQTTEALPHDGEELIRKEPEIALTMETYLDGWAGLGGKSFKEEC